MNLPYEDYKTRLQKIADLNYSSALMQWDQEVYMPLNGAGRRAQQLSTLAGMVHELNTSEELGVLIENLSKDLSLNKKERANIIESQRTYTDQKKYTTAFVIDMSKTISSCFNAWQDARKNNNFSMFQPFLEKLIVLKRKECDLLGYQDHPYNALLNQYEPGACVAELDLLFSDVKLQLSPFIKEISLKEKPDSSFLFKPYAHQKQWNFGLELLRQMLFDFDCGRQDVSAHPFTTSFSAKDVRVTTRINENDIREMIWGCIHEGGHALYEQGLPDQEYGLPSGEAISLGIHESQSRLWENNVGRSINYWKYHYPALQSLFPENLKNISLNKFYAAINAVEPSLIRTSADELTYHFHVLVRYEIEKELILGSIKVKDLPEIWNSYYYEMLGVQVPNDSSGVLQDVHWSHGSFGYFPTYSLGSFYAAQFYNQAKKEISGLSELIAAGNNKPLLDWLRTKIHQHGKTYKANDLCKQITGEGLHFKYFMQYAKDKFNPIYLTHPV